MAHLATEDDIRRIYNATIDSLYGFVASRCDGDRDLAEDVTQEAWLRAVKVWHVDGLPDEPLAWLTTVSRNILANHFRRRPAEPLDERIVEAIDRGDSERTEERESIVSRALARLPVPQFRLLEAFH